MTQLAINTVLGPISGTPPFDLPARVLHIDHSGIATLMTIEESPKRPWRIEAATLANLLHAKEIAIVRMRAPEFMLALDSELPASHCAKRDAL